MSVQLLLTQSSSYRRIMTGTGNAANIWSCNGSSSV